MFAKFNKDGKIIAYCKVENKEEIRPSWEGFEETADFPEEDIWYLIKTDSGVQVDETQKEAVRESLEKGEKYRENKEKLSRLAEDLVQSMAGELVPELEERKAEFIRIHNEVRAYEGKGKRELSVS